MKGQLTQKFGHYPLKLEAKRLGLAMPDRIGLYHQLLAGIDQKANITKWLMENRPWDLFLVVFAELHPAGHYLWPQGARASGEDGFWSMDGSKFDQLRDVYIAIDRAVGEITKHCPDDVTVFIISGDGVGPNHCAWHLLPQVLSRAGFTAAQGLSGPTDGGSDSKMSLLGWLRGAIPPRLRSEIASRLPWRFRDRLALRLAAAQIDWSKTRAFALPADLEGCIRINLRGREPHGIVEPGDHYDDVCSELIELLEKLVNPATGRSAVRRVHRIDRLFPGEKRDHLPDLTVMWNDEAEIREVYDERLGVVSEAPIDPRTGTHFPVSFMAVKGSRSTARRIEGGHIADLAPTVVARFGVPCGSAMDGKVLDILP